MNNQYLITFSDGESIYVTAEAPFFAIKKAVSLTKNKNTVIDIKQSEPLTFNKKPL